MCIRKMLICVLTGMLFFGLFCPKAANATQTPQEFVKEFYKWYFIKYNELVDILKEEKLPEYVDESLISYLKKKEPSDFYYFIQHGETTDIDSCRVVVKDVLVMAGDSFVVPVTFEGKESKYIVIAYVKKSDSGFKITSVSALPTISTRARRGILCS